MKTRWKDTQEYSLAAADAQLLGHDVDISTFLKSMATFNLNTPQSIALLGSFLTLIFEAFSIISLATYVIEMILIFNQKVISILDIHIPLWFTNDKYT